MKGTISVVVAVSSGGLTVHRLLDSLRHQTLCNYEVLLVAAKVDLNLRILARKFKARLLFDERKNRCYARNLGVIEAKGDIIVFLDDDVTLEKDWLGLIIGDLCQGLSIGGAGGIPLTIKHGESPPSVGRKALYSRINRFVWVLYDLLINKSQGLFGWPRVPAEVDFLAGSNMAFRRDVLLEVRGFDENFYGPSAGEDVDLCLRIRRCGHRLILDPRAKAYHFSNYLQKTAFGHREDPSFFSALADNQIYLTSKNRTLSGIRWLPYLLFRFCNALYWMTATLNVEVFFSYIRGLMRGHSRGRREKMNSTLRLHGEDM